VALPQFGSAGIARAGAAKRGISISPVGCRETVVVCGRSVSHRLAVASGAGSRVGGQFIAVVVARVSAEHAGRQSQLGLGSKDLPAGFQMRSGHMRPRTCAINLKQGAPAGCLVVDPHRSGQPGPRLGARIDTFRLGFQPLSMRGLRAFAVSR